MSVPHAAASLFVGDLHPDVNEAMLFEIFNAIGQVTTVRVARDLQTRRSLGHGYVNFQNSEDADRAIERLNFTPVLDRPIRVMWSQRDPSLRRSGVGNVFVKNLDKSIDDKLLFDTFSRFGNILSCKIMRDETGDSKGYAYIHYDSPDAATKAIAEADGMLLGGKGTPLNVAPFQRRAERMGATFTNVYVKGFAPETTEAELREMFAPFGDVTSLYAPTEGEKLKGFAFANFKSSESARKAIEALHGKEIKGATLYVQRAQSKNERATVLRQQRDVRRAERLRRFQGLNLFVKNLDEAIDDAQLMQAFSSYGIITSAKVMRDETGASKGFGFVCFGTPEDASRAMNEMHNKVVGTKPIYVAMHQPREQRKAYLEQLRSVHPAMRAGMPMPGMYQPMYPYPPMGAPRGVPVGGQFPPSFPRGGAGGFRQPPQGGAPGGRPPVGAPQYGAMGAYGGRPAGPRGGPRGGPRQGPPQGGAMPQGVPPQGRPGVQYRTAARNIAGPGEAVVPAAAPQPAAPQTTSIGSSEPLTADVLAGMDAATQNRVLGERLYPLVMQQEPRFGPKVTGMLLQMDSSEILHLLESREALAEAIREALEVLNGSGYVDGAEPSA